MVQHMWFRTIFGSIKKFFIEPLEIKKIWRNNTFLLNQNGFVSHFWTIFGDLPFIFGTFSGSSVKFGEPSERTF